MTATTAATPASAATAANVASEHSAIRAANGTADDDIVFTACTHTTLRERSRTSPADLKMFDDACSDSAALKGGGLGTALYRALHTTPAVTRRFPLCGAVELPTTAPCSASTATAKPQSTGSGPTRSAPTPTRTPRGANRLMPRYQPAAARAGAADARPPRADGAPRRRADLDPLRRSCVHYYCDRSYSSDDGTSASRPSAPRASGGPTPARRARPATTPAAPARALEAVYEAYAALPTLQRRRLRRDRRLVEKLPHPPSLAGRRGYGNFESMLRGPRACTARSLGRVSCSSSTCCPPSIASAAARCSSTSDRARRSSSPPTGAAAFGIELDGASDDAQTRRRRRLARPAVER